MRRIHPSAVVSPFAEIDEGVYIGPFAVVEKGAVIGKNTKIDAHAIVRSNVVLGEGNHIGFGAIIGNDPQDRKFANDKTYLVIGNNNVFREYVTIHRATGENNATIVGSNNYLMAFCHLGHNVVLHDNITMANGVGISGHVTVEEAVNIGGMTGVHQFVRIGKYAMVGGMSRIVRDIPPFTLTEGNPPRVYDINSVGLRRMGASPEVRMALHKAVKLLFRSEMGMSKAIETVKREVKLTDEVNYLINFIENIGGGRFGRQDQK